MVASAYSVSVTSSFGGVSLAARPDRCATQWQTVESTLSALPLPSSVPDSPPSSSQATSSFESRWQEPGSKGWSTARVGALVNKTDRASRSSFTGRIDTAQGPGASASRSTPTPATTSATPASLSPPRGSPSHHRPSTSAATASSPSTTI